MTREEIVNSMSLQDAIQVFRDTNAYGTMDIAKTVILKALEQKPCDYYDTYNKTCRRSEVPVTPQPMWIHVSERLPLLRGSYKISDDVLITNGYENYMGYLVERKGKIFWHFYGSDIEVGINDKDNDVIAWMPLPEPYKAESKVEE